MNWKFANPLWICQCQLGVSERAHLNLTITIMHCWDSSMQKKYQRKTKECCPFIVIRWKRGDECFETKHLTGEHWTLCHQEEAPLPPPSPSHPSGSSQCTGREHPVSCIKPELEIYFTYGNIHVSMPFSQIISLSPSPTESNSLFFTPVSLLRSCI